MVSTRFWWGEQDNKIGQFCWRLDVWLDGRGEIELHNPKTTRVPYPLWGLRPQINVKAKTMGKEKKSNKEAKKQPAMTPKEKKAAKKAKKNEKQRMGE